MDIPNQISEFIDNIEALPVFFTIHAPKVTSHVFTDNIWVSVIHQYMKRIVSDIQSYDSLNNSSDRYYKIIMWNQTFMWINLYCDFTTGNKSEEVKVTQAVIDDNSYPEAVTSTIKLNVSCLVDKLHKHPELYTNIVDALTTIVTNEYKKIYIDNDIPLIRSPKDSIQLFNIPGFHHSVIMQHTIYSNINNVDYVKEILKNFSTVELMLIFNEMFVVLYNEKEINVRLELLQDEIDDSERKYTVDVIMHEHEISYDYIRGLKLLRFIRRYLSDTIKLEFVDRYADTFRFMYRDSIIDDRLLTGITFFDKLVEMFELRFIYFLTEAWSVISEKLS